MGKLSIRVAGMAAMVILVAGCQPAQLPIRDGMVIAQGNVLLDGKPLDYGQIYFVPDQLGNIYVPDGKFMSAINEGKFEIEVTPGSHRVEILKYVALDPARPTDYTQVIPPAYNLKSQFSADVSVEGPNQFAFNVDSGGK